jgi:hypothetical protein
VGSLTDLQPLICPQPFTPTPNILTYAYTNHNLPPPKSSDSTRRTPTSDADSTHTPKLWHWSQDILSNLSVVQYLVYNARKRGLDRASEYFKRTENIAGVKDMRFQALMPDILHWLGIKKIDRMLSMSK